MRVIAYWQLRDGTRRVTWDNGAITGDDTMLAAMQAYAAEFADRRIGFPQIAEDLPGDHLATALGFAIIADTLGASKLVGASTLFPSTRVTNQDGSSSDLL